MISQLTGSGDRLLWDREQHTEQEKAHLPLSCFDLASLLATDDVLSTGSVLLLVPAAAAIFSVCALETRIFKASSFLTLCVSFKWNINAPFELRKEENYPHCGQHLANRPPHSLDHCTLTDTVDMADGWT